MEPLAGRTPRDQNRVPALFAVDTTAQNTAVPLQANPSNGALLVETSTSGGVTTVQGNVASGASDSGNPVKVGGVYNSSAPTFTNGQRGDLQIDSAGRLITTLGTALSQALDSMLTYPRGSNYINLTTSSLVLTGAGKLSGIWVSSATSTPTIKVWDNTSAATTILLNTFTPVAATMYTFPNIRVATGIFVTIGGTVDCTVFYDPTTT